MVNVKGYTESNYISARTGGEYKDKTFIVDSAFEEEVGPNKDMKVLIRLKGIDKPIVLNKTNVVLLATEFGDETTNWIGKKVTFRIIPTQFNGQPTKGIMLEPTN